MASPITDICYMKTCLLIEPCTTNIHNKKKKQQYYVNIPKKAVLS